MSTLMSNLRMLFKKYREQIVYLFVGGITTVIGMGGYWLLISLGVSPVTSNILSWILAVAFAYLANKSLVFQDHCAGFSAVTRQIIKFVSSRLFSLVVETALIWLGVDRLGFDKYLIKIPVSVLVVILNYITGKFLVFVHKER